MVFVFGYSYGCFIAMCFCEYLRRLGIDVRYLGLFDAVAPRHEHVTCSTRRFGGAGQRTALRQCYPRSKDRLAPSCCGDTGTQLDSTRDWELATVPRDSRRDGRLSARHTGA